MEQNAAFRFTDEEMYTAKNTDLPDLLESLWYRLQRIGRYYTTREMDSIRIKDRRTWRRYSNNTGGDAITFLQEFEGKGFREAVEPSLEEERPEFALPPANEDNRRVFAYLRKRGIAPQVIRSFLNAGLRDRRGDHPQAAHHTERGFAGLSFLGCRACVRLRAGGWFRAGRAVGSSSPAERKTISFSTSTGAVNSAGTSVAVCGRSSV